MERHRKKGEVLARDENESSAPPGGFPLTEKEFTLFQTLIHREAGIYLSSQKKALLVGRLAKRIRTLGLKSFEAYYKQLLATGEAELQILLNLVSTNETHFFREPRHFELLEQTIFPEIKARLDMGERQKKIRVWSAACSTGEEPYSLAMMFLEHFPPGSGWEIEILATDISTRVLDRAKEGIWPMEKSHEIPPKYLKTFMLKGVGKQEGNMKAGSEIKDVVRFMRMNLNEQAYPVVGAFDLIFCRNVLIYFDQKSKAHVINTLLNYLEPKGYLFIGHAESISFETARIQTVMPTVYRLKSDQPEKF